MGADAVSVVISNIPLDVISDLEVNPCFNKTCFTAAVAYVTVTYTDTAKKLALQTLLSID